MTPPPTATLPTAREVLADSAAVQSLLGCADRPTVRLRTDRDARYLQWRYASAPGLGYRALPVWNGPELTGLAIGRPRWRGRLAEFTLTEVIVRAGDHRTARRLLRDVARCGADHVATHLEGWSTADQIRRAAGYLTVPRQGMTLVAKPLREGGVDRLDLSDWALSLGDLEVF